MIKYVIILLIGVFISSISQVMLKKSAIKKYDSFIQEYTNPFVIAAYIMFFTASFLSVIAYKGIPLSMGAVLEATSYIYITYFSVKIFKEKVHIQKVVSLGFIILGILVYSFLG